MRVIVLMPLFLIGCVKGESGGGNGPTTNPPPSTGAVSLISNQSSVFFGINNFGVTKSKNLTITNSGTKPSGSLSITSSGDSQISVTSTGCINKKLAVNESCTMAASFVDSGNVAKSYKKTVTISDGSKSISVPLYGYSYSFNDIDYMMESIISKQIPSTDTASGLYQGAWQTNENVSHLSSNAVIVDALISGNSLYQGLTNTDGFSTLYTSNINFNTTNNADWKVLDKSLFYLAINDQDTPTTYSDDNFIIFNPNTPGTNADTTFAKWAGSEYAQPKKFSASILSVINRNYKLIYGSNMPDYENTMPLYLDSRRIINTDTNNAIINSSTDITAQLSYLLNPNRIAANAYIENPLKDVNLYFDYFKLVNNTTNLNKMAHYYINHWQYNLDELQDLPAVFSPSLNLKYNPVEFNYTSFIKPGSDSTTMASDKLWWIVDYSSSYYTNSLSCRDISYSLLNLVNSYNLGQLTASEKSSTELLIQDGILELKLDQGCRYDDSTKKFLSQINSDNSFNDNNGLPLILRIYHRLPDSLVSVDTKMKIYNQILTELSSGSLSLSSVNSNPLYTAETLKSFMELINQ